MTNWADESEQIDRLSSALRYEIFDEEKLLLVGAILGISSPSRTLQLKEILIDFWEADQRDKEEEQHQRRTRKRERELRNL